MSAAYASLLDCGAWMPVVAIGGAVWIEVGANYVQRWERAG
jgi:hypothetical protein